MSSKQKKDNKSTAKIASSGFISFSDVVSKDESGGKADGLVSHGSKGSKALTPVYTGDHSDLAVACKKVLKRDMTTKLKALIDMIAILRGIEDTTKVLVDFLPFFTFAFSKLVYDDNWQVREKTGQLLLTVIEKDKQSLGPFMKDSIGPWWQLASDPVKEVSEKFTTAFVNAIPVKRRPMVLVHLSPHLLKYIDKTLKLEASELKEITQCTDEELDEKYERMIASVIDSIGKFIGALSPEQNQSIASQGVSSSADLAADLDPITYKEIFHLNSLFKHAKSKYMSVRCNMCKLIALAAEHIPSVLLPSNELISQLLLNALDEKFDVNVEEGLHALLKVSTFLEGFWTKGAIINQLVQKLRIIKKSKPEMLTNYLLPILASVPSSKLGIYTLVGEDASKGLKVFQSFLNLVGDLVESEGTTTASSSSSSAADATSTSELMLTCAIETLTFLALRKVGSDMSQYVLNMDRLEQLLQLLVHILTGHFRAQLQPDAVPLKDSNALIKSISAFHRNTMQQTHITAAEWNRLLWTPLAQELRTLQAIELSNLVTNPAENTALILEGDRVLFMFLQLTSAQIAESCEESKATGLNQTIQSLISDLLSMFNAKDENNLIPMMVTMNTFSTCISQGIAAAWSFSIIKQIMKKSSAWMSLVLRNLKKSFAHQDLSILVSRTFEQFLKVIVSIPDSTLISSLVHELEGNASIEGLFLLLRLEVIRNWKQGSIWYTSIVQTLKVSGTYCLSPSSLNENKAMLPSHWEQLQTAIDSRDGRFKIKFLLLLTTTPGLEETGNELIGQAMRLWNKKTSRVAVMFLLHIAARLYKDETIRMRFSDCILLKDADWLCNPQYQVIDKLQSLFFGRDRNTTFTTKYQDYIDSLGNTSIPLDSWQSIEDHLLPVLPYSLQHNWFAAIAQILNISFEGNVVDCNDEFGTQQELQPSKWSRHAHKYISIANTLGAKDNSVDLLITSALFWKQAMMEDQEIFPGTNVERALQCTYEFINSASELDFVDLLLHYDTFLYLVYALTTLSKNSKLPENIRNLAFSTQELVIQKAIQFLTADKRETWLQGIVQKLLIDKSLERKVCDHGIKILKHLLTANSASEKDASSSAIRLNFPLPAMLSCKDQEGYYISQQAQVSRGIDYVKTKQSMFENIFTLSAVPMKLQACHLENGPQHPYYSLRLNNETRKELQTEWNRVLLVNHATISTDSIVLFQDFSQLESLEGNAVVPPLAPLHQIFHELLHDLKGDILACSSSVMLMEKGLQWSLQHMRLDLMLVLFPSILSTSDILMDDIAAIRGLIVLLTSDRFICNPSVLQLTKKIVKLVLSTPLGVGQGLWLSYVIKNIYLSPVLLQTSKDLASKAIDIPCVMQHTMDMIVTILESTDCPSLLMLSETKLLPSLMQRFEESSESVAQVQVLLAKAMKLIWMKQSQQRSQSNNELFDHTNPVKAWELTAFQYLVEFLLQGASQADSYTAMYLQLEDLESHWNALQSLHYAMLGRTRESSSHIMRSIQFARHLPAISSVIFPTTEGIYSQSALTETYRTTFCKLYDMWLVSGEMWDNVQLEEEESEQKKETASNNASLPDHLIPHSYEEFEQDDPDNEARDQEKDAHMFHLVLGDFLSDQISQRFLLDRIYQRLEVDLQTRLSTASVTEDNSTEGSVMENDNEEEESFHEDVQDLLQSAGSVTSTNSKTQFNKKILFKSMVKMDGLGSVLTWLLAMQSIDAMSIKHWNARARCGNYLKTSGSFKQAMNFLVHLSGDLCKFKEVATLFQKAMYMNIPTAVLTHLKGSSSGDIEACSLQHLAIYALFRTICTLPAMFRNYWNDDCKRVDKGKLSRFVEERVRSSILKREVALIHIATKAKRWDTNEFEVKGNTTSGDIIASFLKDETKIEITIKMPPSYPLKNVEVNCTSRIGVSDGRWRRWVLQMIQLLSMQDGSVVDAALLWKSNIEKELEGVEPCPICYCILHTKTLKLPTLACPTCKHKFHPTCLHTWFKTSGKSKCVLCQQPMFF